MGSTKHIGVLVLSLLSSVCASTVPWYQLNDGRMMPGIGLGTWFGMQNTTHAAEVFPDKMEQAVVWAVDAGYRLFDVGVIYQTEEALGRGIQRKIAEGAIKREDVFITDKLWNDAHARDAVVPALRRSLEKLSMDYVDLYLIHFPVGQFEDIKASSAELVYGQLLRLPGELFSPQIEGTIDVTDYLSRLRNFVKQLQPSSTSHHGSIKRPIFVFKDLATATHVFVRDDTIGGSLKAGYTGPYEVVKRGDKIFKILVNGNKISVSIDRIKPAYVQQPTNKPEQTHSSTQSHIQPQTQSKHILNNRHTPPHPERNIVRTLSGRRVQFPDYYRP